MVNLYLTSTLCITAADCGRKGGRGRGLALDEEERVGERNKRIENGWVKLDLLTRRRMRRCDRDNDEHRTVHHRERAELSRRRGSILCLGDRWMSNLDWRKHPD